MTFNNWLIVGFLFTQLPPVRICCSWPAALAHAFCLLPFAVSPISSWHVAFAMQHLLSAFCHQSTPAAGLLPLLCNLPLPFANQSHQQLACCLCHATLVFCPLPTNPISSWPVAFAMQHLPSAFCQPVPSAVGLLLPLPCILPLPFAFCHRATTAACLVPAYVVALCHTCVWLPNQCPGQSASLSHDTASLSLSHAHTQESGSKMLSGDSGLLFVLVSGSFRQAGTAHLILDSWSCGVSY